jgi:hypothetical protein
MSRLTGGQGSIIDLLDLPPDEANAELEVTPLRDLARPVDLS